MKRLDPFNRASVKSISNAAQSSPYVCHWYDFIPDWYQAVTFQIVTNIISEVLLLASGQDQRGMPPVSGESDIVVNGDLPNGENSFQREMSKDSTASSVRLSMYVFNLLSDTGTGPLSVFMALGLKLAL